MNKSLNFLLLAALATGLGLASCKTTESSIINKEEIPEGAYVLDKWVSKLSAVAIKNESVPVTLNFPDLDGFMAISPKSKALVRASLTTLQTGDKLRDDNLKTHFFETEGPGAFKTATFHLNELEGDLIGLKPGEGFAMKAKGTLEIHSSSLKMEGPLTVTRQKGGFTASFKDTWVVNIPGAGMLDMLANLNKNCPQPHRVGHNVKLQGELVFAQP